MKPGPQVLIVAMALGIAGCAAPEISDWPPASVEASDDVIQEYVNRYALKEASPRVYSEIELKALQILQERARYLNGTRSQTSAHDEDEKSTSSNGLSRNEINAVKRRVARKYESSHDQRHELRSKYGL